MESIRLLRGTGCSEHPVQALQRTKLKRFDSVRLFPQHARHCRHIIAQNQPANQHLALFFGQRIDRLDHGIPFITCFGTPYRVEVGIAVGDHPACSRLFLFPPPGFKRDERWLMLALAIIAGDGDTRDLEDPGGNAGLIVGPEPADALDHLQKYVGGQIFRCCAIRHAGSNIAKYPGEELPVECAQYLRFAAPRSVKLAVDRLHEMMASILSLIVAFWFIVVTGARKNNAHGPFVYRKARDRNQSLANCNYLVNGSYRLSLYGIKNHFDKKEVRMKFVRFLRGKLLAPAIVGIVIVGGATAAFAATPAGQDLVHAITGPAHAKVTSTVDSHDGKRRANHHHAMNDNKNTCPELPDAHPLPTPFALGP